MGSSSSCCEKSGRLEAAAEVAAPKAAEKEKEPECCHKATEMDVAPMWSADLEGLRFDHLKVHSDLVRGISLANALGSRRLWHTSPADLTLSEREGLWGRSAKVESFDLFFSHTWRTWGGWKVLTLSFHFGWKWMLVLWLLAVGISGLLSAAGLLPAPISYTPGEILSFQANADFFPWIFLSIACIMALSFAALPYILAVSPKPTMCFLDVVSIHQTDDHMMRKGIYGLGGFLSVAKELHVLWSTPYLSRLWCIFELAAFRKANPSGVIVLNPLFTAIQTAIWMVVFFVATGIYICCLLLSQGALPLVGIVSLLLLPSFHSTRKHMRERHALISQLKNFDVQSAGCRLEKDREFILSAIQSWYGSLDAFNEHVRGPLREELLKDSKTELPLVYALLVSSAPSAVPLDIFTVLVRAGAPAEVVLCQLFVCMVHVFWLALVLNVAWRLCARFAARSWKGLDYVVTMLIYGVVVLCYILGLAAVRRARSRSLLATLACAVASLSLALAVYGKCRCRAARLDAALEA
ncbi:unnamed protein product [Effrenium voratum]|nr:unnamed protein product [Effrenium voratum]